MTTLAMTFSLAIGRSEYRHADGAPTLVSPPARTALTRTSPTTWAERQIQVLERRHLAAVGQGKGKERGRESLLASGKDSRPLFLALNKLRPIFLPSSRARSFRCS